MYFSGYYNVLFGFYYPFQNISAILSRPVILRRETQLQKPLIFFKQTLVGFFFAVVFYFCINYIYFSLIMMEALWLIESFPMQQCGLNDLPKVKSSAPSEA